MFSWFDGMFVLRTAFAQKCPWQCTNIFSVCVSLSFAVTLLSQHILWTAGPFFPNIGMQSECLQRQTNGQWDIWCCHWLLLVCFCFEGVLLSMVTWKARWVMEEVSRGNLHIGEESRAELLCWYNSDWTSFSDGEWDLKISLTLGLMQIGLHLPK